MFERHFSTYCSRQELPGSMNFVARVSQIDRRFHRSMKTGNQMMSRGWRVHAVNHTILSVPRVTPSWFMALSFFHNCRPSSVPFTTAEY